MFTSVIIAMCWCNWARSWSSAALLEALRRLLLRNGATVTLLTALLYREPFSLCNSSEVTTLFMSLWFFRNSSAFRALQKIWLAIAVFSILQRHRQLKMYWQLVVPLDALHLCNQGIDFRSWDLLAILPISQIVALALYAFVGMCRIQNRKSGVGV